MVDLEVLVFKAPVGKSKFEERIACCTSAIARP